MTNGPIKPVRVTNNLPKLVLNIEQRAARTMHAALILGAAETSVLTPIDTGNLINSRYSNVSKDGSRIVGQAGYTADYAIPVNDPDNPQKFRRASATKEFLRKGFENAEPAITALVRGELKL